MVIPEVSGLVDSSIDWKQGQFLFLDKTAHQIKPIATESTDSGTFLGVAQQSITNGVEDGPYTGLTDTTPGSSAIAGPIEGVEVEVVLKTGETLVAGQLLYASDADEVKASGTHYIGVYTGNKAIAGSAAGLKVLMRVIARYPDLEEP